MKGKDDGRSYPPSPAAIEAARSYLDTILLGHEDLGREGLDETPRRMAKAMREMLAGYLV
ncbi:MAG: hypothetical protein GY825_06345, partial [Phycisphaeraceae bacterium]|nr:hypothetical protein [Phycisphaeraceae bacterium]